MTPWRIEAVDEIDSTQAEARRRLEAGETLDRRVFRARRQTAGRGRRGGDFDSRDGGSYQSLVRADADGRWRHGATVLAVAVGLAEALGARGAPVRLKWPNDLLDARHLKLGGLLAEHVRGHLIVGVGLNVGTAPDGFAALPLPLEAVHEAVLEGVDRGLVAASAADRLPAAYARWDALAGRTVRVRVGDGGDLAEGRALGVDADGALRLASADGERRIAAGTVEGFGAPPSP